METVDEEVTTAALDFMDRRQCGDKPFFVWWNSTRMHIWTHLKPESEGKTGLGVYADGMVEHDAMVGQLLAKLEELGVADNTIVMYSTDNGAEVFTWPDGGTTMFRNEKATQWEGGFRVPTAIRWPGVIEPGTIINESPRTKTCCPRCSRRPGSQRERGPAERQTSQWQELQGPPRRLQPAARAQGREASGRARSSSTGPTTAASRRCATTTGKITFLRQDAHGMDVWQTRTGVARADAGQPADGSVRAAP